MLLDFRKLIVFSILGVLCLHSALAMVIDGRLVIPDGSSAGGLQVALNGNQETTLSREDGSFRFHDIPSGVYTLDVLSLHAVFPQAKLKVEAETNAVTVVEFKYPGAKRTPIAYPIVLTALAPVAYFQQRPPLNIIGMLLGNPMMLMMIFSVGVMFLMPKLTEGMDEEELKKLQAEQGDPMKNLQKLMGMDTKTNDDPDDD